MTVQSVPGPELVPNHCLVCHTHRDERWLSLDQDLLEGHAYLCGGCADAVAHAAGGLTAGLRVELEDNLRTVEGLLDEREAELRAARDQTFRVVGFDELLRELGSTDPDGDPEPALAAAGRPARKLAHQEPEPAATPQPELARQRQASARKRRTA